MVMYESKKDENGKWFLTVTFTRDGETAVKPSGVGSVVKALIDAPIERYVFGKKDKLGIEEAYVKVEKFDWNKDSAAVLEELNKHVEESSWSVDNSKKVFIVPEQISEQKL